MCLPYSLVDIENQSSVLREAPSDWEEIEERVSWVMVDSPAPRVASAHPIYTCATPRLLTPSLPSPVPDLLLQQFFLLLLLLLPHLDQSCFI